MKSLKIRFENSFFSFLLYLYLFYLVIHSVSLYVFSFSPYLIKDISKIEPVISMLGSILAGILAIFFSISIIVIQHAASNYTASIIDEYKYDFKTWFTFLFFVWSILLVLLSLNTSDRLQIIDLTIITSLFSILFLINQFIHIINLINPRTILTNAINFSISHIENIPSLIDQEIESKKPSHPVEIQIIKEEFYRTFLLHKNNKFLDPIKKKIIQINDVIFKASSRREIETSIMGFNAYVTIISKYCEMRKDDQTPDDEFINYIYDQLLSLFEVSLSVRDLALTQEIIKTFEKIGIETVRIKSIRAFDGPHNATVLSIWHLHGIGKRTYDADFQDATLHSIHSIRDIGIESVKKHKGDGLANQKLFELGAVKTRDDWVVYRDALHSLKELLYYSVLSKVNIYAEPDQIFEKLELLLNYGINNNFGYHAYSGVFPLLPEFSLQKVAMASIYLIIEKFPQQETKWREDYCKDIIDKYFSLIGKIMVTGAKNREIMLIITLSENVLTIILSLLNINLVTDKDNFRSDIKKISRYMYSALNNLPDTNNMGDDSLSGTLVAISIHSLVKKESNIVDDILLYLYNYSINLIKKDEYGYDSIRMAANIGIIGLFSMYKNDGLFEKTINLLCDFDKIYLSKHKEAKDREHIKVIGGALSHFKNTHMITQFYERSYEEIYKQIPDNFVTSYIDLYEELRKKDPDLVLYDLRYLFT